jgi:hypothetical protein
MKYMLHCQNIQNVSLPQYLADTLDKLMLYHWPALTLSGCRSRGNDYSFLSQVIDQVDINLKAGVQIYFRYLASVSVFLVRQFVPNCINLTAIINLC